MQQTILITEPRPANVAGGTPAIRAQDHKSSLAKKAVGQTFLSAPAAGGRCLRLPCCPSIQHGPHRFVLLLILVPLLGCQTPERRQVMQRMDQLQADNSALKARSESQVAQARMDMARQRQDDLAVIEALSRRYDDLANKLDALRVQPRPDAAQNPKEVSKPVEQPEEAVVRADLERVRVETREQMKHLQEELAKAQAQSEAARAAAATISAPQEQKKALTWNGRKLPLIRFIDSSGQLVDIGQFAGQKPVVLAIMKGFYSEGICVYCTEQTAGLARSFKAFKDLNTEVLVVYPGREEHINDFVRSIRDYEKSSDPRFHLPFKVLLDVNQDAVRALGIAGDLAHPTSFILDKNGVVQYQRVGRTVSDRPTADDLLQEVRKLGAVQP